MATRTSLFALSLVAIAGAPATAQNSWIATEISELTAGDAEDYDRLGQSVALSGDTAVAGAFAKDTPAGAVTGAAYVFIRTGSTWSEQQRLTASDGSTSDEFGVSIAISGDTVVVGAPRADLPEKPEAGAAYVYVREGTTWTEQAKLTASDPSVFGIFGSAVAVSGDTIGVGAPLSDPGGLESAGAAYVFVRNGTTWTEQQKLTPSDPSSDDLFGWSIAIDEDRIAVGAEQHHHEVADSGSTYVFVRNGTTWTQEQELMASDATHHDAFGWSVAIAGDTILVGAIHDGLASVQPKHFGSAYVFIRGGTGWTEQQKVVAGDGEAGDGFGASVALGGDLAVVGATEDGGAGGPGAAYVFARSGTVWTEQTKLLASDGVTWDNFGISVAVANDTLAIGAPNHDHGAEATGSAYVFGLSFGETYCTAGTSASGCQALLSATGTPSATAASGFVVSATSVEGAKDGLFFFGTKGQQANPWGSGTSYQCVVPPVKRCGLLAGTGTVGVCDGALSQDLNALWCPTCPKPGHNPGAGVPVQTQLWYRDPANTSNQTTSLSDAIEFVVGL